MKKIILLSALLIPLCVTKAQTIKGFVLAAKDKTPVEFANVLILNLPDSSMARGVVTYTDGQYTAENIKPGKYYVKVSYVGFQGGGKAVEISGGQKTVRVDTIFLTEKTNKIDDVVVTGQYVRAKELVDRTVYEILPEVEKTSTNGYDVLKKIPSVQVDFNNNVTLDGKSNFIIQVDGKQRDKEFLARLLPSDIKSIEIIHNPSGKYDGSIEGVINVILKKGARVGVNGNFGMQLKPVGKTTMGAMGSIDYGREKATFYVSGYSFLQRLNIYTGDYSKILKAGQPSTDSIIALTGQGDFGITASSVNIGCDYNINDNNSLSLNYSYKPYSMKNNISNDGDIFINNMRANYQENSSDIHTNSGESNISLFYRKKFKKPIQELTVESNYYFFNSTDSNRFKTNIFGLDRSTGVFSTNRPELTENHRDYMSTKIDYVQPVGVTMRFEAGYQFYLQGIDYNFTTNDINLNNQFNYNELRNAGYVSYYWNLKDFSWQATVRVENSQIDINKEITNHYTTVLPSTNLLYKINSKQSIKFTYNRRINRPGIYNLNPFQKSNNNLSITAGNPYLEPEHKDRLQLTYTLNVKKINVAPYIYHEFYSNKIANLSSPLTSPETGNLAIFSSPKNVLNGYEQGFGLNTTLWVFNFNGSFYKDHFDKYSKSLPVIEPRDYLSFRLNSYIYAPLLKKKLNAFAFISYKGPNITAQTRSYSLLIYGFGAQSNLKNHTIGIFYLLPMSKDIVFTKNITQTPVIYSRNTVKFDASWFIQVMYSYKFNKGKAIKKAKRKVDIESDTKGGGLGR